MDILFEHIRTGVLRIHARHRGDAQLLLHRFGDSPAGHTVTSGIESRTSNKTVGRIGTDHIQQLLDNACLDMGAEVVVSTDHRGNDLRILAQQLTEGKAGTPHTFHDLRRIIRMVLSADTGEKLIDIMDNPFLSHRPFLLSHGRPTQ